MLTQCRKEWVSEAMGARGQRGAGKRGREKSEGPRTSHIGRGTLLVLSTSFIHFLHSEETGLVSLVNSVECF